MTDKKKDEQKKTDQKSDELAKKLEALTKQFGSLEQTIANQQAVIDDQQKQLEEVTLSKMEQAAGAKDAGQMYADHNLAMKSDQEKKQAKVEEFMEYHFRAQNSGKYVYSLEYRIHNAEKSIGADGKEEIEYKWFDVQFTSDQLLKLEDAGSPEAFTNRIGQLWHETCSFKGSKLVEDDLIKFGQPAYRNGKYKGKNKSIIKPMVINTKPREELALAFENFKLTGEFGQDHSRRSREIEIV